MKVTYHDPCHLCHGQQVRNQPRQLLAMIPLLQLVPLDESELCCGAAGTYNLTQPEMSEKLGRRKFDHITATGAAIVATGNVGCILQLARQAKQAGNKVKVVHPIDLLDLAYRGSGTISEPSGGSR
jgi:glycolate oxidase iron-sulfur subunit